MSSSVVLRIRFSAGLSGFWKALIMRASMPRKASISSSLILAMSALNSSSQRHVFVTADNIYYVNSRIGYLVSQYPATNHTFILREVRGLRATGAKIEVCSIRRPDRQLASMTPEEQEESTAAFYVSFPQILGAHLRTFAARPAKYLRGFVYSCWLAGPDLKRLAYHLAYLAQAIVVGDWLRKQGIAHLHSHFSSTVALLTSHVFPITWSATFHGPDEFTDPIGFHLAEKCRSAAFHCAVSNFAQSQMMRWSSPTNWPKYEVARLGVDTKMFLPRPFRESPETYEIIFVGRLAPVKAQHVLLDAIGILVKRGRSVRLRLVGGGESRSSLKSQIQKSGLQGHVVLEGPLNQDRVLELYRQTDIFALASFAEGIPVVLMEAMAMEIPCIATWVNGIPELIRDGIDGLLVAPSDVEGLANAIERLIDDSELRRRLGQAGRRRVIADYNLERNVAALGEIFQRRLSNGVGGLNGYDRDGT
jgi:colanic acid/amylovoran biosynthesis glycosyltransferase